MEAVRHIRTKAQERLHRKHLLFPTHTSTVRKGSACGGTRHQSQDQHDTADRESILLDPGKASVLGSAKFCPRLSTPQPASIIQPK